MANSTAHTSRFPVAFQVWRNGEWQKSATYASDAYHESGQTHFEAFIDRHYAYAESGQTTATLVICENAEQEREKLSQYFGI